MKLLIDESIIGSDYRNQMLFSILLPDNDIPENFDVYREYLTERLAGLIDEAVEDDENIAELIEYYLGVSIMEDDSYEIASAIIQTDIFSNVSFSVRTGWNEPARSKTLVGAQQAVIKCIDLETLVPATEDIEVINNFNEFSFRNYLQTVKDIYDSKL